MIALIGMAVIGCSMTANAETDYSMPSKVRCTCYVTEGITKSGTQTHIGTISGKAEWLGYVCVLYEINEDGSLGDYIGQFTFEDTGSNKNLIAGKSVDVWQPSLEDAYSWIDEHGDYVYMQVIPGEG